LLPKDGVGLLLDDDARGGWKPGARAKAALRTALDLIFPPQSLDDGPLPLSSGFSAQAWNRIAFIDGSVCDGCGLTPTLITNRNKPDRVTLSMSAMRDINV